MTMSRERSVLVIDDDETINMCVAAVLEDDGYRVIRAGGGKEALRLLTARENRPDVILLDLMMPEMDGRAFRTAQLQLPDLATIPVLLFTAYGVRSETFDDLRVAGILRKPLRLADLTGAIEEVLRACCPAAAAGS